jgi:CheY-like chemotaxis protein
MEIARMSNILVVEDEANVRKLVTVNLISRGYTVFEAQDVHQALARLQTQAFDQTARSDGLGFAGEDRR